MLDYKNLKNYYQGENMNENEGLCKIRNILQKLDLLCPFRDKCEREDKNEYKRCGLDES